MPDLSKDSGLNPPKRSHKSALTSSVHFRSTESIHSLSAAKPYMEMDPPRSPQYPLQYCDPTGGGMMSHLPPGFAFQEEDRPGLVSSASAARLPPISEGRVGGVGRGVDAVDGTPQRRRTPHHHHHHHSRRSRRSRSENALHLVAERRARPPERPALRLSCEDYDRFPPPRGARERYTSGGGAMASGGRHYHQQPFRPCPRTTSDLCLQNPGTGRRSGLNQYRLDDYEDEDDWCSTCSSSSESEDEGYFLGEPIPRPVQLRYLSNQELVHKYNAGVGGASRAGQLHSRKRRKSKNCIIS